MSKPPFSFALALLLNLFMFLSLQPFQVISQSFNTERSILLELKLRLGNPHSLQSWNSSSSPCDWPEITCAHNKVTGISLHNKNITEKIPATICDLHNLKSLDVSNNYISGEFPRILNCSKLEYLVLSQNYFVGPIPADIGQLSRLRHLDITTNNYSGDIPAAIGRLRELRYLSLVQNEFNGTWPVEICNLSNLEHLAMAYNDKLLHSTIPKELGALNKLKFLWMTDTNLIGGIPGSFNNLSRLEHLDLSFNNLNGSIPGGMLKLNNLANLYLYNNRLSGHIPWRIESFNLIDIDLSSNSLIGSIPEGLGKLQNLTSLSLFWNRLSGVVPPIIALIPSLKILRVFRNRLGGALPSELGILSNLEVLDISENQLSGPMPQHLCARGTLFALIASSNKLSGQVPKSLGDCGSLLILQLFNNSFSGEIPSGLWASSNLTSLMLNNNLFSGKLPGKLGSNLLSVEISNNRLSGPIPVGISSWVNIKEFKASNNLLSGKIPVALTSLPSLSTLLLDGNQFSGQLPSEIYTWNSLTTLNFARNQFSGPIPKAICSLPRLAFLDLSENQFSGQVPSELGHFNPNSLNLSSNNLSGKIPHQLEKWDYENSFSNNPKLCGNIPTLKRCSGSHKLPTKYLAMIIAFPIVGFVVIMSLCTFFMVRYYIKEKGRENLATRWKFTAYQKFNFTEDDILSNLKEDSLIGKGGSGMVYRVPINNSRECVAVKRILINDRKLDKNLEKQFTAEAQILGSIRHANIVKMLCTISSESSKLLVYEYMENQSLDKWLHSKKRASSSTSSTQYAVLDWPKRRQIAIGAAQGLRYMHEDCYNSIIHRDVKSSNILLDSQFKAKIADFGLAKMLTKQEESGTTSDLLGSFGYIAPGKHIQEFYPNICPSFLFCFLQNLWYRTFLIWMTERVYTRKANEKMDVYSYGVVLLELTTGREAIEGNENKNLAEWAWKHLEDEKPIEEALDGEIMEQCYREEMIRVFKLGLRCTGKEPSARPHMKEVVSILGRLGH